VLMSRPGVPGLRGLVLDRLLPGTQPVPVDGVANVTGYAHTSLMSPSSGPITAEVTGYREAELAEALDTLPSGPVPNCLEDFTDYQVAFRPSPGAPVNYQAVGHGCVEAVVVSEPGKVLVPRHDKGCALFDAVDAVLPAAASGTLSGEPECKAPAKPRTAQFKASWSQRAVSPRAAQCHCPEWSCSAPSARASRTRERRCGRRLPGLGAPGHLRAHRVQPQGALRR